MGNEFLRKQRESRAKGWNRQLRAGAQDMFVSLAPGQELGCRASVHHGEMPQVGRKLMLQLSGDAILVRDENVCIGEVNESFRLRIQFSGQTLVDLPLDDLLAAWLPAEGICRQNE